MPLKGIFLASAMYGDMALRPMNDIDLLCRIQDVSAITDLFCDMGYRQDIVFRSPAHERAFLENAGHLPPFNHDKHVPVEIHFKLFAKKKGKSIEMDDIWDHTSADRRSGNPVRTLFSANTPEAIYLGRPRERPSGMERPWGKRRYPSFFRFFISLPKISN